MSRLSNLQKRILRALDRKPVRTITGLAERLRSPRPSVSRSLHSLRKLGYITEPGQGWLLTDKGKEETKWIGLPDKDITSQVSISGYDEEIAALTKCACGWTFVSWEFNLSIYREDPMECPNCHRKLYCSIKVRVYEVEE